MTLSAAIIAGTVSAHCVQAAPAALAKTITGVAMAKGATASVTALALVKGALNLMAWANAKTAVGVGVSVLLAAGAITVAVEQMHHRKDGSPPVANPANTFRLAGIAVDTAGKPVAGAVVECYQYGDGSAPGFAPFVDTDMEVKQRTITGPDGAFELRASPSTVLVARKPGLATASGNILEPIPGSDQRVPRLHRTLVTCRRGSG